MLLKYLKEQQTLEKQGKTLGKLVVLDEWLKEATAFSDHVVHSSLG